MFKNVSFAPAKKVEHDSVWTLFSFSFMAEPGREWWWSPNSQPDERARETERGRRQRDRAKDVLRLGVIM